jgi:hypothetical protein
VARLRKIGADCDRPADLGELIDTAGDTLIEAV